MAILFFSFRAPSTPGPYVELGKSKARMMEEDEEDYLRRCGGFKRGKRRARRNRGFSQSPSKFVAMGARLKGVLLVGLRHGKTYLSKSVAGEAKVLLYIMSGSDFVEIQGRASRVRDLFETAKK